MSSPSGASPLWSKGVEFDHATRGTGASQELAFGDNNDGMALYTDEGRTVLAVNNEYVNRKIIYGGAGSGSPENADDRAQGARPATGCRWWRSPSGTVVGRSSRTPRTIAASPRTRPWRSPGRRAATICSRRRPTRRARPASGHGTIAATAARPGGTYLACEENFNGYFSSSDPGIAIDPALKRYGIGVKDWGYAWATADERFDISKHPTEPNRAGYVVEIDPRDPDSIPKKRTALGRFKHENAELVLAASGQVVVYMGDDERGRVPLQVRERGVGMSRAATNAALLASGQLFAAKFADGGRGEWVELTPESTGIPSVAEICIHTRMAASAVGATTMDRPEWVAAESDESRGLLLPHQQQEPGQEAERWRRCDAGRGPESPRRQPLRPDRSLAAGRRGPPSPPASTGISSLSRATPLSTSTRTPDHRTLPRTTCSTRRTGLAFDSSGMLWIQTDGNYSNNEGFAGQGNNQMLVGDPQTGEIRRFMVGPKECEVTGFRLERGPEDALRRHPAPGREGRQPLPGRREHHAPLGDRGHRTQRRRHDRLNLSPVHGEKGASAPFPRAARKRGSGCARCPEHPRT